MYIIEQLMPDGSWLPIKHYKRKAWAWRWMSIHITVGRTFVLVFQ